MQAGARHQPETLHGKMRRNAISVNNPSTTHSVRNVKARKKHSKREAQGNIRTPNRSALRTLCILRETLFRSVTRLIVLALYTMVANETKKTRIFNH